MIPKIFSALIALAIVALVGLQADAQYRRGCYTPTYYTQPCYQQPYCGPTCATYPSYGSWQWGQWETDPAYWVKSRWINYSACDRRFESDGYLYIKTHCGFDRALLKSDYAVQYRSICLQPEPRVPYFGTTQYGIDPYRDAVARAYGPGPARLLQQQPPSPLDVAALLPPPSNERAARIEHAGKGATSANEALKSIALAEAANERVETEARRDIAMAATHYQAFERAMGKFNEVAAVANSRSTVSSDAARSTIPVDDPELAAIISTKCLECHGGGATKGGVDFRDAKSFKSKTWGSCWALVKTGAMPDGGQRLSPTEVKAFERQFDLAIKTD
ncbi:hypothetical protein [Anatilimnocola floriformis]|uniref:hypothetical protein n=1 Tax=Anatilimnocola floriformis TaxID=2948575 RepID=UPI0020C2AD80|nr:hypothetical protein [Anatilimnocola floriformis]